MKQVQPEGITRVSSEEQRPLNQPPRERFAGSEILLDLKRTAEALMQELAQGQQEHRQRTLYKHGPATLALFCFRQGSRLHEHRANGTVVISVLEGKLTITTSTATHSLEAGQVLVLTAGVIHDVFADAQSIMLLTVCLEPRETG